MVVFHLQLCVFKEEHAYVPQDEHDGLFLPDAVGEEGHGVPDTAHHSL